MREIPIVEIKSIDSRNSEKDLCPFSLSKPQHYPDRECRTNKCMAWYWTGDDSGCCALIYRPEHILM